MPKVAIYCRLSDEDRNKLNVYDDSESIQNQKNLLTKYSIEKGWDIYRIYSDDDYSGLDSERPEFNRMLKDAENRSFDIILCKNQARFTRDMELVEKYLHKKFVEWGIRFVGYSDNCDTCNNGNKRQRQIIGLTNEWYCEEISENIKTVLNLKRNEGLFIGSFAPYGYRKDPNDKNKLIVDENAARVVRMIFNLYLEGYGTQQIAHILNQKGILNPTKYKQEAGLNYKNAGINNNYGLWNKTTVKRILKSEIYLGHMVQGKRKKLNYKSKKVISTPELEWIKVRDTHQAVIEKKIFDEVQRRIEKRQRSTGEGKAHIFATKVRCADCGSTMNKVTVFGTKEIYTYLRCRMYTAGKNMNFCSSHSIRLDILQNLVIERLKKYLDRYLNEDSIKLKLQEENKQDDWVRILRNQLRGIEQQVLNNSEVIKSLYIDKVNGIISSEQFIELNNDLFHERDSLNQKRADMEKQINELERKKEDQDRWIEAVRNCKAFQDLSWIPANDFVESIEIGERDLEKGEQKIIIHWLF